MSRDALASIVDRLTRARAAQRANRLLWIALRLLAVVIAVVAGFFVVDWLAINRILPLGWGDTLCRLVLLLAALAVAGRELWQGFLAEWRLHRDDDTIAIQVEHAHRDLGGRLISAVQLGRDLEEVGDDEEAISAGMIEALVEDTADRIEDLDVLAIVDRRPLKRYALIALTAVAVTAALVWWRPGHATALLARMALLNVDYPTASRIIGVNHQARIAEGEPYPIEVEVDPTGFLPERVTAAVDFPGGRSVTIHLDRVEDAAFGKVVYRGEVAKALESFRFRPVAYDHRWPRWEEVSVVRRPAVAKVAVVCTYPAYLGMEATTAEVGDLRVPEGTGVAVEILATKPIATAELVIREGRDEGRVVPLTVAGDQLSGTFSVGESGTWSLRLVDGDGLSPSLPPTYTISAIPDRLPIVQIQAPAHDKLASPKAVWPLRFSVKDDHGIGQGWLKYQIESSDGPMIGEDGNPVEVPAVSIPLPGIAGPGEAAAIRESSFDLGRLGVQAGQRVTYWIEVADNKTPNPGIGASNKQRFTILDVETLRAEMERQRAELFERISLIKERQKEARDGVDDLRRQAD